MPASHRQSLDSQQYAGNATLVPRRSLFGAILVRRFRRFERSSEQSNGPGPSERVPRRSDARGSERAGQRHRASEEPGRRERPRNRDDEQVSQDGGSDDDADSIDTIVGCRHRVTCIDTERHGTRSRAERRD